MVDVAIKDSSGGKERGLQENARSCQQSMWKTSYSGEKSRRQWEGERVKPAG